MLRVSRKHLVGSKKDVHPAKNNEGNVAHPAKNNEGQQARRSVHVTLPLNCSLALLLTTHLDTMANKEVLW